MSSGGADDAGGGGDSNYGLDRSYNSHNSYDSNDRYDYSTTPGPGSHDASPGMSDLVKPGSKTKGGLITSAVLKSSLEIEEARANQVPAPGS